MKGRMQYIGALLALLACTDPEDAPDPKRDGRLRAVEGLTVEFDTVAGIADLKWYPSQDPRLHRFVVYRNWLNGNQPVGEAEELTRTEDTRFRDTVRSHPSQRARVGYSVRMVDSAGVFGPSGEMLRIDVVPIRHVLTLITLVCTSPNPYGRARVGDSIAFQASYSNYSRNNHLVHWTVGRPGSLERSDTVATRSGISEFGFVPQEPFATRVRVTVTDEAGSVWSTDIPVYVEP